MPKRHLVDEIGYFEGPEQVKGHNLAGFRSNFAGILIILADIKNYFADMKDILAKMINDLDFKHNVPNYNTRHQESYCRFSEMKCGTHLLQHTL
jgi:hypothetical protein